MICKTVIQISLKGCKTTKGFINKYKLGDNNYIYARLTNNKWTKSNGTSKRVDKLFVSKKWFKTNFCYFRVKDIADGFGIKRLDAIIIDKKSSYIRDEHYFYFNVKNSDTKKQKKLFVSYTGLLRILFGSHKKNSDKFVNWASSVLFVAQMGTKEQRIKIAGNIIGIPPQNLLDTLSASNKCISCVYLFMLGKVDDLRGELSIPDHFDDDDFVYKWGKTYDMKRRTKQHIKTYSKMNGAELKLVLFEYVDPQYVSKAEAKIKHFIQGMNLTIDNDHEMAVIPSNKMKLVKEHYGTISDAYVGNLADFKNKYENIISEVKYKLLQKENELLQKDKELLQKDHELLLKDYQLLKKAKKLE